MRRKKKILFLSEAAYLNTGYAKYSKEVLSRLHNSKKYEVAELSVYGSAEDPRRKSIPWKNYPNLPSSNNEKEASFYGNNPANQFGAWRFERTCLDFEPDVVFSIRDFWMDSFVFHSPYRRIFQWAWMPTVDAAPQNPEWISMFSDADYVLTYSDWAKRVLEEQAGNTINTVGVASPSASSEYRQMDKKAIRDEFGIPTDWNIVGTVMRNQRRKLFPVLIEAFAAYLKKTSDVKTYLYLHTSYPDAGWNLAELLHENGISSRVLMSYVCSNCHGFEVSCFQDAKKVCPYCKSYASTPCNVSNGISETHLAKIYNLFDLYVQCANSEGFGLPQVEAAACGTPIACTNYSAMEDIVQKLSAFPIGFSKYKELETGCDRAVPDKDSIVQILESFFAKNVEERSLISKETRDLFEKGYSWDKTTEEWMKIADVCEYADWKQPPRLIKEQKIDMKMPSTMAFIETILNTFMYTESHKNSHFSRTIHTDLIRGSSRSSWDSFFSSEFSPFSDSRQKPCTREIIVKFLSDRLRNYNIWEDVRSNRSKLGDGKASWLN